MLTIENLHKSFGSQVLFKNGSFAVGTGEHIGIVGPNGAGKTTFFRMLVGEEQPDDGYIRIPKGYKIVLLRQEWLPKEGDSVLEATLREHSEWYTAKQHVSDLEKKLARKSDAQRLAAYQDAEHRFTVLGGHIVEQSAKELLSGLGFQPSQFDSPAQNLSGGWRIRCHLAGLLLQEADLLLLDEPTNHLDVDSVEWFEDFLQNYPHTFMVISHDRRLIQRLSNNILEFAPPQLNMWPGSLKQYESQKSQRIEQLQATIANKQKEIDRMEDFVRRFRAKATKARQAQSRLKSVDHYQKQISELLESMPNVSKRPASFRLELRKRLPRKVIEYKEAVFGYEKKKPLFSLPHCLLESGKKIGVVGVNGVGKSTFLKTCALELPLLQGNVEVSENVTTGFFAQHRMEELPNGVNTLDYLQGKNLDNSNTEVRSLAASIGLTANDLDKNLDVLSGGEKARVSLTRILLSRPGMLLLDEPTNHLDLEACDALIRGLKTYAGTLLLVSHNRHFLDSLVDYILEVRPGEAILHHRNYSDWLKIHKGQGIEQDIAPGKTDEPKASSKKKTREQKRLEAEARKAKNDSMKGIRKEIADVDERLKRYQKERSDLDDKLCLPESPKNADFSKWLQRHAVLSDRIPNLEQKWLELSEKLETIENS